MQNNDKKTKSGRQAEPMAGMSLGDIYFVLFRHKWKIVLLSLVGFVAAAALPHFRPPPYESLAKLLIKYVPESTGLSVVESDQKVIVPDTRGSDIINSEIQILTSLDVADEAATNLGPSRILAGAGGGNNPAAAAALIHNNLHASPANDRGSVIVVTFRHPNPQIVQPVLQEVINDYFQKHYEIHQAPGQMNDLLTREITDLRVQLNNTEQQLSALERKAGVISFPRAQTALSSQIYKIQDDILNAQAELASHVAALKELGKVMPAKLETTNTLAPVPREQMDSYKDLCARLDGLRKTEQGYFANGYTSSNVLVMEVDSQIAALEKDKTGLESKYPQLAGMEVVASHSAGSTSSAEGNLQVQVAQVAALQARIKTWNTQLNQLQTQATNLNNLAPSIAQLEQTRQMEATNLQTLTYSLQQARISEALETGKAPNIKWVQWPSPPFQDWKRVHKKMAILAVGGVLAGLAWAFLIELFLDPTIKRPVEIESKLKLPLFLSIPDVRRNSHARLPRPSPRRLLRASNSNEAAESAKSQHPVPGRNDALQIVSQEKSSVLQPFYEALRDRLVTHFEVRNLNHKPKLVAVTGANHGSGVSSIAAGLAASLSETGDGNVLLVDMNLEGGAAQQFYKGTPGCGLDAALEKETKESALVQEKLYVVSGETNSKNHHLPSILPKRFASLLPKLKASDFDYIIFDMPTVTQTSITARLAAYMDMVLLVIESEKSNREVVQGANALLAQSGATVSAVLNKTHRYVPKRLHREFLSDQ